MSTASRGKKWERDLCSELEEYPLTAERVPRSVADALPGPIDDVIVVPQEIEVAEETYRPITDRLQVLADESIDAFTELLERITQIEVKYSSDGGYGLAGLLSTHLETCGLGTVECVEWAGGYRTGGLEAFVADYTDLAATYELDETLAKGTVELLEDADAAALKAPRKPWVLVWEASA